MDSRDTKCGDISYVVDSDSSDSTLIEMHPLLGVDDGPCLIEQTLPLGLEDDIGIFSLPPEDSNSYVESTSMQIQPISSKLRRVLKRFGFNEVDDESWNLYWTDFSVSNERVVAMKPWQKINHFPGMSEICRKDYLARNLNRMLRKFPDDYLIFPKTWCLPTEWNEFQNFALKHKARTYIVKPDTGCQGKGIFLTKSFKDIQGMNNSICQLYLTKPFLINGYKFDIRLYILLTSCDPLRIYSFRDGLVRFTTVPYVKPSQRNTTNLYMHLTNYAVQKKSADFVRDDEEGGTKRRITTLNRWLLTNGYDVDKMWKDIDDVVIKTVLSGYPVLRHNYRTCFPTHVKTSACFEILGFDIMLDVNLKPFIIEVNHSPSFTTDSQLDKEIKEAMLWDTLQLANFNVLNRKRAIDEERKRIRERLMFKIHPKSERSNSEVDQVDHDAINHEYELSNAGNFRLVYPREAGDKTYDKFIDFNEPFFHETAAYKNRIEFARQLRQEIKTKQEKIDAMLKRAKPESPSPATSAINRRRDKEELEEQVPIVDATSEEVVSNPDPIPTSWKSRPICWRVEQERRDTLIARTRYMRNIGLIDAVRAILADSPGVKAPSHDTNIAQDTVIQREKSKLNVNKITMPIIISMASFDHSHNQQYRHHPAVAINDPTSSGLVRTMPPQGDHHHVSELVVKQRPLSQKTPQFINTATFGSYWRRRFSSSDRHRNEQSTMVVEPTRGWLDGSAGEGWWWWNDQSDLPSKSTGNHRFGPRSSHRDKSRPS